MYDTELKIYIDGSALTNPGTSVGCAGIIKYPESLNLPNKEIRWPYKIGTSGSMELLALVNALKWINKNTEILLKEEINSVSIFSDSEYVVNGATNWIFKWSDPWNKNKWKKSDGGSVRHKGLWKDFLRERKKLPFRPNVEWIEGKSIQITKDADKAAKKAARSINKKPNFDQTFFKIRRSLLGKKSELKLLSEVDQTHLIRVCSHGVVGKGKSSEYEVRFEIIKGNSIEGRFKAFTSQKIGFENIDGGNYYYATFNSDENLPWITEIKEIEKEDLKKIKKRVQLILLDNIKEKSKVKLNLGIV